MTKQKRLKYEDEKKAYAALMRYYPLGLEDLDDEIWRNIDGYDGDYAESN